MSVVLHTHSMARFACDRLACSATALFPASTENEAVRTIRERGWRHEGKRSLCPKCIALTARGVA